MEHSVGRYKLLVIGLRLKFFTSAKTYHLEEMCCLRFLQLLVIYFRVL